MTSKPKEVNHSGSGGPSEPPIEDAGVQRKLTQLFGESLLGPWPELHTHTSKLPPRRRGKRRIASLLAVLAVTALIVGVHSVVKPKLERQDDPRREQYVQDLTSFFNDGNLEQASQFVKLVRQQANPKEPNLGLKSAELNLVITVQAALYRYFDASPARLQQIQPYLDDARNSSPLREIARMTLLSREERASKLGQLQELYDNRPDRNELNYLVATALESRREVPQSRETWERDAKLQPAWLGHRFEQAWFEARQNRMPAALEIAVEMLHIDPNSHWSLMAAKFFGVPRDVIAATRSDATAPSDCPVARHFDSLVLAIEAARSNQWAAAGELLKNAAAAVQFAAPFLLDAFDWCDEAGVPDLARELTKAPGWPRDSAVARAKLARLSSKTPSKEGSPARTQKP